MKLLLTSEGLVNSSIIDCLSQLLTKPFSDSKLTFIPTAANVEPGGKEWLINNFRQCQELGFAEVDIVDIAVLEKKYWQPRLEKADILLFGGGNAYYLMYWLQKSGVKSILPELLKTRIYVGISAGSMVTTSNFYPTFNHDVGLYDEEIISEEKIKQGLSLVNFHVIPHLNSNEFPKVRISNIDSYATQTKDSIYAIDDQTAIQVNNNNVSLISEGTWKKFN